MKCYRKNGSDPSTSPACRPLDPPSMKCYRKNGSDPDGFARLPLSTMPLNEVLPKER